MKSKFYDLRILLINAEQNLRKLSFNIFSGFKKKLLFLYTFKEKLKKYDKYYTCSLKPLLLYCKITINTNLKFEQYK